MIRISSSVTHAVIPVYLSLCLLNPAQAASTKESIEQINLRLDQIEQLLQSRGLLDMLQQLESLQLEFRQLRGEIEIQNHSLDQITDRQRALYTDLDQRIQRLETNNTAATSIDPSVADTETAPDSAAPPLQTLAPMISDRETAVTQQAQRPLTVELVNEPATAVIPATSAAIVEIPEETVARNVTAEETVKIVKSDPIRARADYEQAFKLLKQSLYDQAIKAFAEFLTIHPNSDYSDNAQYWLAEAYYVTGQFDHALTEYNNLVRNYPDSQKLTHALLKIGYSKHELGQNREALAQLEDLKQNYPGTTAARLASDRIKKINSVQAQQPPAAN